VSGVDGVNSADSTDRATGILGRGPAVSNLLISLRSDQWTKNRDQCSMQRSGIAGPRERPRRGSG
jgi:hypothetical protein